MYDLTGEKFGKLTVLERDKSKVHRNGNSIWWICRCECGNICSVDGRHLRFKITKSCGCYRKEFAKKHGMKKTKIYRTWADMKARCENPNIKNYPLYGGRGIKVCERWHDFSNFYADVSQMEHFGEQGYSLDRIDVNGDYEPCNVRWTTAKEQANNRRNNRMIEYNGEEMTLAQAAEKSGIPHYVLRNRIKAGDTGEYLFRPVEKKGGYKNVKRHQERIACGNIAVVNQAR